MRVCVWGGGARRRDRERAARADGGGGPLSPEWSFWRRGPLLLPHTGGFFFFSATRRAPPTMATLQAEAPPIAAPTNSPPTFADEPDKPCVL